MSPIAQRQPLLWGKHEGLQRSKCHYDLSHDRRLVSGSLLFSGWLGCIPVRLHPVTIILRSGLSFAYSNPRACFEANAKVRVECAKPITQRLQGKGYDAT